MIREKENAQASDEQLLNEFESRLRKQHEECPDEQLKDASGQWLLKMVGMGKKYLRTAVDKAEKKRRVTRTNVGQASFAIGSGTKRNGYDSL